MADLRTNTRGAIILALALGPFAIEMHGREIPSPVIPARPAGEVPRDLPATITFTIPLTLDEVGRLDHLPAIADVLRTARHYPEAPIHLAAYVAAQDASYPPVEALGGADRLVVEVGVYLIGRGVEAGRITGRGVGVDSAIGPAVVVSFDVTPAPSSFART